MRSVHLGFRGPFLLHHVHRVHHAATLVVRLRVAGFLQFGKVSDKGDAPAQRDTRVSRHRFAVSDGFSVVQHMREEIQHAALHEDARDQRCPRPASRWPLCVAQEPTKVTKPFTSSCMRKYPWVPRRRLARRCAVDDERSPRNRRERHFRNTVDLESLVHLELLAARKCEGDGEVVGVEAPLGGVAQVIFHGVQAVEVGVQVRVHQDRGEEEDGEGQVEVEREVEENQGERHICDMA